MTERASVHLPRALSVSQVTSYLKLLVESDDVLSALSVRGEICEFSRAASGHLYFAIKDAASQVNCVMFRKEAGKQAEDVLQLRKGVSVVVHGFLTVYEPRSQYQIYVERIVPEGEGEFARRFEALRVQLDREGLFAAERKRVIPQFPKKIALLTSPGSQAYHDVLHRLRVQCPFVQVVEVGVSVQGDRAPDEIVTALDIVNRLTAVDLILLVRGGGSPEDLQAFNDERLARAVFASRIPVISGVGHETDYTIVDYVADYRAATPSLAAAAAVPDLAAMVRAASDLHADAERAVGERLRQKRLRWIEVNRALLRASPQNRLRYQHVRLDDLVRTADGSVRVHLRQKRAQVTSLKRQLEALNPLAILSRGYAVLTENGTDRVIGSRADATAGMLLRAHVADGEFSVRVEGD